jgi:hypothetical protein
MAIVDTFHLDRDGSSSEPTSTLSKLIAEECAAWEAQCDAQAKADKAFFAWREANPKADEARDKPAEIIALYAEADALVEPAADAMARIAQVVPDNLADCVRLLEWDIYRDRGTGCDGNLLAGLRIIAGSGDPVAQPVTGDRRIFGLFEQWLSAHREANGFPIGTPDDDPEYLAACDRDWELQEAIIECPASSLVGVAVKFFIESGIRSDDLGEHIAADLVRLARDLGRSLGHPLEADPQP